MKLFAIAFYIALVVPAGAGELKRDIRGFFPGMQKDAFGQAFTSAKCKSSPCKLEDGTLTFVFSSSLPTPALTQVEFVFESKTFPGEMIKAISKQYRAQALTYPQAGTVSVLVATSNVYGGRVAVWKLAGGLELFLHVKGYSGDHYILVLSNQNLLKADDRAKALKNTESKVRHEAEHPAPKF